MIAIFLSFLISLVLSNPHCKYFGLEPNNGPLVAVDVCKQYNLGGDSWGSYKYKCSIVDGIYIDYYQNTKDCSGFGTPSENQVAFEQQSCSGGVCDHLTLRNYHRVFNPDDTVCTKDDSIFIEHALVSGCWENYDQSASWDLTCNSDSFELKKYTSNNCGGNHVFDSSFGSGCDWFNFTIPVINGTINGTNVTIPTYGNLTYHEITECGGGTNYLWYIIGGVIGFICCCCCIIAFFCHRRRRNSPDGYIQQRNNPPPQPVYGETTYG